MVHSRALNKHINDIYERAGDNQSSFKELLEKDRYVTIHHKNFLVTEIFKVKNDLAADIMKDVF